MKTRSQIEPNPDSFPTDTAGLPASGESEVVEVPDGGEFELRIAPVTKRIEDADVRMLAYNGSIPGPTLKVRQGSEVAVHVANGGDLESTVHWHGVRVENRFDGTHQTQHPIAVGGRFTYRVQFPDPGVYWYHPHIREDHGQEMGLYGNILVVPENADYWPPVDREVLLTLDDVLLEDGRVASFSRTDTNYAAMGRYGNTMLVAGRSDLALNARPGEVVRFYLTNTANTRVFNVGLEGARMKLVGGDSGRLEREEFVDEVLLAPSERAVVDVLFDAPGRATLEHRRPGHRSPLASITVGGDPVVPSLAGQYQVLRSNPDMAAERKRVAPFLAAAPDKTLAFVAEMDLGGVARGPVVYTCPMHPEEVSAEPGRCPVCGMKLLPSDLVSRASGHHSPTHHSHGGEGAHEHDHGSPMHDPVCGMTIDAEHPNGGTLVHEGRQFGFCSAHCLAKFKANPSAYAAPKPAEVKSDGHRHGQGHVHEAVAGIEWEDDMVAVNRITTPRNMRWKIIDRTTGAENHAIDWQLEVGDQVKVRLVNEMDSDHPMQHPFHVHGSGRFLVLSRDGVAEPNLVWKDTVLVRTGQTVDILLDVTNPGVWMAHCHIAEHHESGMMFSFKVR